MGDVIGGSNITPKDLEFGGSKLLSQLPLSAQHWAQAQAAALVSKGQFGPAQQRDLASKAGTMFPAADQAKIMATVRYLALKGSAGGNVAGLQGARGGLSAFQQQLVAGVTLRT